MSAERATLCKLSDTNQTVADPNEDIRGHTVTDVHGEEIGKVEDLLVDEVERKVRFFVLADGGFLGIGKTKTFIPVEAISQVSEAQVTIDRRRDEVADAASRYDPALAIEDAGYFENLYGYYGYSPFWAPASLDPRYPRRSP